MPLVIKPFKEKKIIKSLGPLDEGLDIEFFYVYDVFPRFKASLFYPPRRIENYNEDAGSLLKFLINNE